MQGFAHTLGKDGAAMKIKGAIFDLDGTLLDSMLMWDSVGARYLRSLSIQPKENLNIILKDMSLSQGAEYIQKAYGVEKAREEIIAGVNAIVESFYTSEAQLKDGVTDFLRHLAECGVRMCIATATEKYLVEAALSRLGVSAYFSEIFTCNGVGHGKDEPHIYEAACRRLGTPKESTLVFEDAAYAIETAKSAGFPVAGVYDETEENQEKVRRMSDFYITDFKKAQEVFL